MGNVQHFDVWTQQQAICATCPGLSDLVVPTPAGGPAREPFGGGLGSAHNNER